MGSINNLSSSDLQSVLGTALQGTGLSNKTNQSSLSGVTPHADGSQLSPLAQLMSTLQQLQQTDPTKYQQVTQQIATNLQNAAQTAQSDGNTAAAKQLNQLSADFTQASQSGQLPNIQDLAQAIGGHHHHHGHGHHAHVDADGDSDGSSSTSSTSQTTGTSPTDPLNPATIIQNTLSGAGVGN